MTPSPSSQEEARELKAPTIYVRFTEGRYGTHIQKWAHEPFDGATAYSPTPDLLKSGGQDRKNKS
jgi:hypothetical protein